MVVHDIEKDILYVWLSVIVGFFTCYLVEGAEIWKKDVVQTFTSWWTCKQLFRFHFLVWIPYVCLSQEQNKRHLVKPCRFVFLLDSHFFFTLCRPVSWVFRTAEEMRYGLFILWLYNCFDTGNATKSMPYWPHLYLYLYLYTWKPAFYDPHTFF